MSYEVYRLWLFTGILFKGTEKANISHLVYRNFKKKIGTETKYHLRCTICDVKKEGGKVTKCEEYLFLSLIILPL